MSGKNKNAIKEETVDPVTTGAATNATAVEGEEPITAEEYAKRRAAAMAHLKSEIEYLEVEAKYEGLVADVEEHKTRGMTMIAQRAQFFARQAAAEAAQTEAANGTAEQPPVPPTPAAKPPRKLATN